MVIETVRNISSLFVICIARGRGRGRYAVSETGVINIFLGRPELTMSMSGMSNHDFAETIHTEWRRSQERSGHAFGGDYPELSCLSRRDKPYKSLQRYHIHRNAH